jgi:hypothetical protein
LFIGSNHNTNRKPANFLAPAFHLPNSTQLHHYQSCLILLTQHLTAVYYNPLYFLEENRSPMVLSIVVFTVLIFIMIGVTSLIVIGMNAATDDADAQFYTQDAVELLTTSGPVAVTKDTSIQNTTELTSALEGTTMKVVVLPNVASNAADPTSYANLISERTGGDTIVIIDKPAKDIIGVSTANNSEQIETLLNNATATENGDGGAAVNANIAETLQTASTPEPEEALSLDSLIWFLVGFAVFSVAFIAVRAYFNKLARKANAEYAFTVNQHLTPTQQTIVAAPLKPAEPQTEESIMLNSINSLRQELLTNENRIPASIATNMTGILRTLEELLPKWSGMEEHNEQKFTINRIINDYLPNMLHTYLELPKTRLTSQHTATEQDILNQLSILQKTVNHIQDSMYETVAAKIKTQKYFLENKYGSTAQPELN